jgi:RNA polymerase sigma-70 factor (TIGR02960 family)
MPDSAAFGRDTEPFRRELFAHCYRMLGSVADVEDLVQETYLRAWRSYDSFEGRSSMRTWLYQIATNACLTALSRRDRRVLPSGLYDAELDPTVWPEDAGPDVAWLDPIPDTLAIPETADPAVIVTARESLRLALIASLQYLPPRQRAVLVLRDVLGYRATEVASMLDTTEVSVNSALQRARATLEAAAPPPRDRAPLPRSSSERELVGRFADAFETGNADELVALLTDDAWVTMPPEPFEYQGQPAITEFFEQAFRARGGRKDRLVATRANGQPAFGHYIGDVQAPVVRAVGVIVLTLEGDRISHLTRFGGSGQLARFGLPRTLPS